MSLVSRVIGALRSSGSIEVVEAARAEITTSKDLEAVLIAHDSGTASGVSVTPQTAMMVAAVGAAVSLLSETSAMVPLPVFIRTAEGGKERAPEQPAHRLFNVQPNDWQNAFEFREMLMMHLTLWGNFYAFKNRRMTGRGRGDVMELLPIHPDRVRPEQDDDYVVTYRIMLPDGSQVILPRDAVFHVRDRTANGFEGISRLKTGRDTIGLARVTERWGAQLFGNGARPSGILTTDGALTAEQMEKLRESWQSAHGGENALGTAVLDGGIEWKPVAFNGTDSQLIENRKFQIAEIARIYRIPPHMIGDLERATFSNIEHQSLEFVKYSLAPWFKRIEAAINTQLLQPGGEFFAEHVAEGLLRGDAKSRFEGYASALQNEWMTRNEVRRLENLNPVDGGDEFRNPAINPVEEREINEPAQAA